MQGRALLGHLMPDFDDVQRVSVFPSNRVEGHTSFVPQESHLESGVLTRGYLESQLVRSLTTVRQVSFGFIRVSIEFRLLNIHSGVAGGCVCWAVCGEAGAGG